MSKKRVGFGSLGGLFIFTGLLLTACGADVSTVGPSTTATPTVTAATTSAATPTATTAPATTEVTTAAATTAASTTAAITTVATATAPATTVAPATTAPEAGATATPIPTTAPATTAPATPTATPANSVFIFYLKDSSLWAAKADGSDKQKLADNIYAESIKVNANLVVFYQSVKSGAGSVLQLRMVQLANGNKIEGILDNHTNETVADRDGYQNFQGRSSLAISPDGTQVAYTKINNAAPAFEGLRAKEHPTELWLANLDPKNPAPKRLAPNDKDFMANPAWSTDGNRIAFVRTSSFGTGAGFPTEVWSVFKDGSRLSYLTGPDVAKVGDRTIKAYPAFNLNWVGPLALAYEASTQLTGSIMLHDLSQNSDTSYVLAAEADYNSVYCPQIRRYVYTRVDTKEYKQLPGLYSVGVDKPGTATAVLLDEKGTATFGCENDTLLYKDSTGQLYVQRLNADGSANGAKVKIGFPNDEKSFIRADISPGGKYVTIEAQDNGGKVKNLGLYRADGVNVLLGSANLNFSVRDIRWPGEQILVLEGARAGNESGVLASINLTAPNPSVKLIEDISNYINLV